MKSIIKYLFVLGMVVFAFSGCSLNDVSKENLENMTFILDRSGTFTMEKYAFSRITITKDGLLYETFNSKMNITGSAFTEFENGEFEGLVKILEDNNYRSLKDRYTSDIMVADIGLGNITIINGEYVKNIVIDPYISEGNPKEIRVLVNYLNSLLVDVNSPFDFGNNNENSVIMKYVGKQCEGDIWDEWYSKGEINYVSEPTKEQLILDYYSFVGVDVINVEEHSNGVVCEACLVCPAYNYYTIEVNEEFVDLLSKDNWNIVDEN